jgi:hypothetical protein
LPCFLNAACLLFGPLSILLVLILNSMAAATVRSGITSNIATLPLLQQEAIRSLVHEFTDATSSNTLLAVVAYGTRQYNIQLPPNAYLDSKEPLEILIIYMASSNRFFTGRFAEVILLCNSFVTQSQLICGASLCQ